MGVAHTWTRFRGDLPLTSVEEAGRQARRGCASPRLVMSARSPLTLRTSSVYPHESADGDPPRVFPLSHTTRRSANGQSNVVLFAAPALSLSLSLLTARLANGRTNDREEAGEGRECEADRAGGRVGRGEGSGSLSSTIAVGALSAAPRLSRPRGSRGASSRRVSRS